MTIICADIYAHLLGGKAAAAAFYPPALVEARLRSIRDTADAESNDDHEHLPEALVHAVTRAGKRHDVPAGVETHAEAEQLRDEVDHQGVPLKFAEGKVVELDLQRRDSYRDEYTNDVLPKDHVRAAMANEISYLCREAIEGIPLKETLADPKHVLVSGRWITSNEHDAERPDCRGRYVAQEINHGGEADAAFYAATPPLEAKRKLFSMWSSERTRHRQPLQLHVFDVKKACFNALPRKSVYIRLPKEMGLGRDVAGRLKRRIYGPRDAGALWEATFTKVLIDMRFEQERHPLAPFVTLPGVSPWSSAATTLRPWGHPKV